MQRSLGADVPESDQRLTLVYHISWYLT
ncbi:uncharacterized protein METZ01_LOCUS356588 [marine metagenome]|uniref:Uncharacterized protein n=1 Tax=marine metagenome TaxID=408172 RepID=A0A382S1C8_9ZZZZ